MERKHSFLELTKPKSQNKDKVSLSKQHTTCFDLKHQGLNNVVNGTDHPYGFGGKEEQEENKSTKDQNSKNPDITNTNGIYLQRLPRPVDFVNTKSKEEKEEFKNKIIEWAGFFRKFGKNMYINPNSIIASYSQAKKKNKKSIARRILDLSEDIIGGDSSDHNYVILNDHEGNSVKISYI